MRDAVVQKIERLPEQPGVYIMHGKSGVLYVGKAKNLKKRWSAYRLGTDERQFVRHLDRLLYDIEIITTQNEKEALLLERELIRQRKPRFNVKLTDDKRFLSIELDLRHPYPKLRLVRQIKKTKGVKYFGPYHSASAIRSTLQTIHRYFLLRTCTDEVLDSRKRPCLQYQIKRCLAPCVYPIENQYQDLVTDVQRFLGGQHAPLLKSLKERMTTQSEAEQYEQAAHLRDQIIAIERSFEKQNMVDTERADEDWIGLYREASEAEIFVQQIRAGRPTDSIRFALKKTEQPSAELMSEFLVRYYMDGSGRYNIPQTILLAQNTDSTEAISELLKERANKRVHIKVPMRGSGRAKVQQAQQNARLSFIQQRRDEGVREAALQALVSKCRLRKFPHRLECIDISHLQGKDIVASLVCFEDGKPFKAGYRTYRLKDLEDQNDFAAIFQVVSRRIKRGLQEENLPDLFVIDGGKGQLNAANAALEEYGLGDMDLVSLAKARSPNKTPQKNDKNPRHKERVFVRGHKDPIILPQNAPALLILMQARDEAHRFAVKQQRKQRTKSIKRSHLENIEGIGPKRRAQLLKQFGSLDKIKDASEEELQKALGPKLGTQIYLKIHASKAHTTPVPP